MSIDSLSGVFLNKKSVERCQIGENVVIVTGIITLFTVLVIVFYSNSLTAYCVYLILTVLYTRLAGKNNQMLNPSQRETKKKEKADGK